MENEKELKRIWKRQKKFNENFIDLKKTGIKEKQSHSKEMILHLISECDEVLREMNWKLHRREQIADVRKDKIQEELIDVFKYWLTLAQIWDMEPEDFIREFDRKSEVVEQRYKQEFKLNLLEDKNVVAVDIDGVLCDYPDDFIRFVEKETKKKIKHIELIEYNLYDILSEEIGKKELKELKHKFRVTGQKRNLTVLDGAKEGLDYLKSKGYTVVLLTARPYKEYPRIFADTIEWLKKNGLKYDAILWDEEKEERILREFPKLRFMVEDHMGNANKIASNGYPVLLMEAPYNKNKTAHTNVARIKNWKEAIEKIEDGQI